MRMNRQQMQDGFGNELIARCALGGGGVKGMNLVA